MVSAELEGLFWQSVMNSTNPAEFEAYLRRFRNGVFSELSQTRLAALCMLPSSPTAGAVQEPFRMRRGFQESAY